MSVAADLGMKSGDAMSKQREICILAGGLSERMGREKPRLRLGRRTMLGQICATAATTGLPVRIIRRDCVARCGPLGGVSTALKGTGAAVALFLACDMPFVTAELLQSLLRAFGPDQHALFVCARNVIGFPFLLRREVWATVAEQIARRQFSIRALAQALEADIVRLPRHLLPQLLNVNTLTDWERARCLWRCRAPNRGVAGWTPHRRRAAAGGNSAKSEWNDSPDANAWAAGRPL
jgi:molybdenum cofactor guanylyltransferase